MKNKIIIALLLIPILGVGLYIRYCDTDVQEFIVDDTNIIFYSETDEQLENSFKDLEDMLDTKEIKGSKLYKDLEELDKYIQKSFIIQNGDKFLETGMIEDYNFLMGINVGNYYLPAMTNLYRYFDKTDSGNYRLKEDLKDGLIEDVKSSNPEISLDGLDSIDLYLKPIKSYFIMSLSEEKLNNYRVKVKKDNENSRLTSEYKELKNDHKTFFVIDMNMFDIVTQNNPSSSYIDQLDFLKMYMDYDYNNEKLEIYYDIEAKKDMFEILREGKKEDRKLVEYVKPNRLYFSNESFSNIAKNILKKVKETQGIDYNQFSTMILGTGIPDIADNIGNELVIDYSNISNMKAVTNLGNNEKLKDIFKRLGLQSRNNRYIITPKYSLVLEEKNLFLNGPLEKPEKFIEVPSDSFLYSKLEVSKFMEENKIPNPENLDYKNINLELRGKTKGNSLIIRLDIPKSTIKKLMEIGLEISNKGE